MSKGFGGVHALSDMSIRLAQNRIVGVIGPNGAGKTTMFNVITGAYRPDAGDVTFDGRPITAGRHTGSSAPASPAPSRTSACSPA